MFWFWISFLVFDFSFSFNRLDWAQQSEIYHSEYSIYYSSTIFNLTTDFHLGNDCLFVFKFMKMFWKCWKNSDFVVKNVWCVAKKNWVCFRFHWKFRFAVVFTRNVFFQKKMFNTFWVVLLITSIDDEP